MIITTILLLITGFGIYLLRTSYDYDILGGVIAFIFGAWLLLSSFCLLTVSYHHELFVVKRGAFENTLNSVRKKRQ